MIRYALYCDEGHRFDSWFFDSSAFDEQAERGLVACPVCESRHVVKAIMAPALVARRADRAAEAVAPKAGQAEPEAAEARPSAGTSAVEVALLDKDKRQLARAFRDKVVAETRDVGSAFAAEARRIHDDDASKERIRGRATLEEARGLLEDGIMVLPLPTIPDDLN